MNKKSEEPESKPANAEKPKPSQQSLKDVIKEIRAGGGAGVRGRKLK